MLGARERFQHFGRGAMHGGGDRCTGLKAMEAEKEEAKYREREKLRDIEIEREREDKQGK